MNTYQTDDERELEWTANDLSGRCADAILIELRHLGLLRGDVPENIFLAAMPVLVDALRKWKTS